MLPGASFVQTKSVFGLTARLRKVRFWCVRDQQLTLASAAKARSARRCLERRPPQSQDIEQWSQLRVAEKELNRAEG
jgi:hypothetical protein